MIDCILGWDPGLKGAAVHYDPVKDVMHVLDNRMTDKKFLDPAFVRGLLALPRCRTAVLENVKMMGEWSSASNATMQRGMGSIGTAAGLVADDILLVSPMTWKGALFLTSNKQLSMDVAHLRFPAHRHLIRRHDHAEAALLVSWLLHGDPALKVTA